MGTVMGSGKTGSGGGKIVRWEGVCEVMDALPGRKGQSWFGLKTLSRERENRARRSLGANMRS